MTSIDLSLARVYATVDNLHSETMSAIAAIGITAIPVVSDARLPLSPSPHGPSSSPLGWPSSCGPEAYDRPRLAQSERTHKDSSSSYSHHSLRILLRTRPTYRLYTSGRERTIHITNISPL